MPHTSIQQAYTDWSATYDTDPNRTRDLDRVVTQDILGARRFRAVLEIGCGTGKNTDFYVSIGDKVHALDFSDGMLAQARIKVRAPTVTFSQADLTRTWPVTAASVDLVVCNLVLEHIADLSFICAQASRVLVVGGDFFVCELHPFRQYRGSQANFIRGDAQTAIPAFIHHTSDYTRAAKANGFRLERLDEWWHPDDVGKLPRLLSLLFKRQAGQNQ